MENLSLYTTTFVVLMTLCLISDTLGLACYETMPDGEIARISCSGSCEATIWRKSGKTEYKCNQGYHRLGCTEDKEKRDCFCNTNLCNRSRIARVFKPTLLENVLNGLKYKAIEDKMSYEI